MPTVHNIINNFSTQKGGAEKLVRNLHQSLLAQNIDCHLVGVEPSGKRLENSTCYDLPKASSKDGFLSVLQYLHKQVKKGDIVHAHLSPIIFFCAAYKAIFRKKFHLILTEHNSHNRRRNTLKGWILDRFLYAIADEIICISEGVKEALNQWIPLTREKTPIIHNGVDLHFSQPIIRKAETPVRILSVGRLSEQKNYEASIEAIAKLNGYAKLPAFTFTIAGAGPLEDQLKTLVKSKGLESIVQFIGHVEDIENHLQQADIYLMTSKWEGFGLAAVEAMNASLPLVVSDVLGISELVPNHAPCATLVDPNSVDQIAQALRQLINDPKKRSHFGQNAFANAKNYSLEKMVNAHIKRYRDSHARHAE